MIGGFVVAKPLNRGLARRLQDWPE